MRHLSVTFTLREAPTWQPVIVVKRKAHLGLFVIGPASILGPILVIIFLRRKDFSGQIKTVR